MDFWKVFKIVQKVVEIVGEVEQIGGSGEGKKSLAVESIQEQENLSTEKAGEIVESIVGIINSFKGDG